VFGSLLGKRGVQGSWSRELATEPQTGGSSSRTCRTASRARHAVEPVDPQVGAADEGEDEWPTMAVDPLRKLNSSRLHGVTSVQPSESSHGDSTRLASEGGLETVRYTKFRIEGFRGEKRAVFIPDCLQLQPGWIRTICEAVGVPAPSAAVCGVGPLAHPAALATPQLRDCEAFRGLVAEGRSALGLPQANPDSSQCPLLGCDLLGSCREPAMLDERSRQQKEHGELRKNLQVDAFVDRVLERRVVAAASSVAQAAHSVDAWLLSFPALTTFEAMLQSETERPGEPEVFKAVAAHMQDAAYMDSPKSKLLMRQLFESSVVMDRAVTDSVEDYVVLGGDLWDPQRHATNAEFREHGMAFWSFESPHAQAARGHPVAEWPWPHADLFLLFYREAHSSGTSGGSGGAGAVDWQFKTRHRLDRDAIPLQPEMVAPPAYVFVGDGPSTKRRMLQLMQVPRPAVVLDNTPGTAKQFGLLLGIVGQALEQRAAACRPFLRDGAWEQLPSRPSSAQLLKALAASKILHHVNEQYNCSHMNPDSRLSLSDVVQTLDMVKARPGVFRDTLCVVDPLTESHEATVSTIASALCSPHVGSAAALGSTRSFSNLAMHGWQVHHQLLKAEKRLARLVVCMELAVAVALMLPVVLAVVAEVLLLRREAERETSLKLQIQGALTQTSFDRYLPGALGAQGGLLAGVLPGGVVPSWLVALPVLVGLAVVLLQGHLCLHQKWSRAHHATALVMSEIFHLLGGLGGYGANIDLDRQKFIGRLKDLTQEVSDEAAVGVGGASVWSLEELQAHVENALYGMAAQNCMWRRLQSVCDRVGLDIGDPRRNHCAEYTQELVAPLCAQSYMEVRARTLMASCTAQATAIGRVRTVTQIAILALLGASSGLAALNMTSWMPICLIAAFCTAVALQQLLPQDSVAAIDITLATLSRLEMKWHAAGIQERRSNHVRHRLIAATERAAVALAAALARAPFFPRATVEAGEQVGLAADWQSSTAGGSREKLPRTASFSRSGSGYRPSSGYRSGSSTPGGPRRPSIRPA